MHPRFLPLLPFFRDIRISIALTHLSSRHHWCTCFHHLFNRTPASSSSSSPSSSSSASAPHALESRAIRLLFCRRFPSLFSSFIIYLHKQSLTDGCPSVHFSCTFSFLSLSLPRSASLVFNHTHTHSRLLPLALLFGSLCHWDSLDRHSLPLSSSSRALSRLHSRSPTRRLALRAREREKGR